MIDTPNGRHLARDMRLAARQSGLTLPDISIVTGVSLRTVRLVMDCDNIHKVGVGNVIAVANVLGMYLALFHRTGTVPEDPLPPLTDNLASVVKSLNMPGAMDPVLRDYVHSIDHPAKLPK